MADTRLPLAGLRVVDMADEKGELAGRLLADLGADVVRVEPPAGAASRSIGPFHDGRSLYFAVRNANKRTLGIDLGTEVGRSDLVALLAQSDIWLESSRPGELAALGLDPDVVHERFPELVIVSITDFGQDGPYRNFVATDPVMEAMAWMLFRAGVPDRPPVLPPGAIAYDIAGISAAFAALTAYRQRQLGGTGQWVDVSVMEAVAQTTDWGLASYSVAGAAYTQVRNGAGQIYPIIACRDGWVRPSMVSLAEWRKMRAWLGEPEALQDPALDTTGGRVMAYETLIGPALEAHFAPMAMIEAAEEGQRRQIPITPLLRPRGVLEVEHFRSIGTFTEGALWADAEPTSVPSGFFVRNGGERIGFRRGARGVHSDATDGVWRTADRLQPAADPVPGAPFAGVRVLDFGVAGAAPEIARLLGEYGADVIRIEIPSRPDIFRQLGGPGGVGPVFASSNRTKRSFGVALDDPRGQALVEQLVQSADVVVENLPPGTIDRFGFSPARILELNPGIVMISSQTMGLRGPWRDWRGYGANTQPPGGLTYLWSFAGEDQPIGSNVAFPDHVVGRLGAVAAAAHLIGASGGHHLEVVQAEVGVNLLADLFAKEALEPGSVTPQGNRSDRGAPWGVYPAAGEQRFVVITCRDDADWRRLVDAMGRPDWATPDLAKSSARQARRDEIDAHLAAWTSERSDRATMELLQRHGVPAGYLMYTSDTTRDPQHVARGYALQVDQPGVGPMVLEGSFFRSAALPAPITLPAPLFGEHSETIARELLGLADGDVADLIAAGVLVRPSEPAPAD